MRRTVTPELLDRDAGTAQEIAESLADLRRINRWFGGVRVVEKLVRRVGDGARHLTWLDVASASGDIVEMVERRLAREGVAVKAVALDRAASHLPATLPAVQGDALALPFADGSFDVVSASLLVHHLEPDEVRRFAGEALRVCRRAVILNDLRRSWTHLALVYAGMPLYRSRLTRHDGVASVKQAYTESELRAMLTGLAARVEVERFYLCRMGAVLWKEQQSAISSWQLAVRD